MKKILVTGAAGYIGSILCNRLLDKRYEVIGVDNLSFGGEALLSLINNNNFKFIKADIREKNLVNNLVKRVDSIIHLAAIVGDPACAKEPDKAKEINWDASVNLFNCALNNSETKRFIFASTCSNYGKMKDETFVNENSTLNPVSLYARLKVDFENYILNSNTREDFSPVSLRFATVYGLSPRMRFDLTVNEFMRDAFFNGELVIYGEQFWRPYCHVEDIARAIILSLESDQKLIDHNVFNVGDTSENYQKKMLAEEILKLLPETKIKFVHKEEDPRDYKVDFSKINSILGYKITKNVRDGLREILEALRNNVITEPYSKKYQNI